MKKVKILSSCVFFIYAGNALASGNVLPRANSESLGMADANVAIGTGPATQFINPANLIDTPAGNSVWEAGSLLAQADALFSRSTAASGASAMDVSARRSFPLIPFFAIANRLSDRMAVGFSVDSPHGLSIEWKDHTWDIDLGASGKADMVKTSQLTVIRLGPSAAWKVSDSWSVGARVFAQYVNAVDENDIATLRADGASAGLHLGTRYRDDNFAFGLAYTTPTNTKLNGEQTNIHPVATSSVPGTVNTRMLLPWRLQTGVAFRMRPDLWWEVDLDWIGWSYNDSLTIYQANGTIISANKAARHYVDTLSVRTGLKWEKSPRLALHAGIGYDPTPVPERDASPTTTFLRKTRLAFGARYKLERDAKIDFAYQFIRGHQRRINATDQDLFGSTDTHLFEGTYESRAHVFGLSYTASF